MGFLDQVGYISPSSRFPFEDDDGGSGSSFSARAALFFHCFHLQSVVGRRRRLDLSTIDLHRMRYHALSQKRFPAHIDMTPPSVQWLLSLLSGFYGMHIQIFMKLIEDSG